MEAAARKLDGFKGFKRLKPGKRQAMNALTREGYVQAKGRLQCWNADGQELGGSCREGCAGKGRAATLEQQRLTARGLGGSCCEEAVLPRGIWMVLRVLSV